MTHVESRQARTGKESIHSGHFMVSHFEAEAQDDFDDLAVPVPDEEQNAQKVTVVATYTAPGAPVPFVPDKLDYQQHQQLSIETSLTKLFKCMTLAYRQKLTSPKWNRFKGIKLRWKDKIRLNNVIWRCWHMQFIKKQNTLVCQFASPLDVDTHVKPETTILEGKYWKRRAEAVIAEYKKWRMFHIMRLFGKGDTSVQDTISDMDTVESLSQCGELAGGMLTDEDYLSFMSDTLFSTISSHQPFAFPDPREIARGASLADFIQPSLGPLQPNLDDFMDTLEPLHDILSSHHRLPPVPEEPTISAEETLYRSGITDSYSQGYTVAANTNSNALTMPTSQMSIHGTNTNTQMMPSMASPSIKNERMQMYDSGRLYVQTDMQTNMQTNMMAQEVSPSYAPAHYEPAAGDAGYGGKRMHYAQNTSKIVQPQENTGYTKYSAAGIPPSQTAPETVSLLQQPVQNPKYASTMVIQGRPSYSREKPRARINQYPSPVVNNHYGSYSNQAPAPYEARQYLAPAPAKQSNRAFKMPSPPLAPASQQVSGSSRVNAGVQSKESYRSNSLPLGAALNTDWSISAPAEATPRQHAPRARETTPGAIRLRSRSTSSQGEGGAGGRRPPPLNSVASEPALPQASVMLAQLLSQQHSQSVYKMSSAGEEAGVSDPTRSPAARAQPSPIGSDIMSPICMDALGSPSTSPPPSPGSPREPRRTHLHAEQKRRYNIKNGFDTLQSLIPHLNNNPAAKVSKAAMLQKGAEYIKQLKAERNQIKEEMESLRQQIECLNNSISNCHSLLPATGAPVSRARAGRLREMFARHVANRTLHNWKYWLFSVVAAALQQSFSACVSCGSGADLVRTTLLWAEQHCSLVEMRPAVLNSLRVLCTSTEILTNPERLPEEARAAAAAASSVKSEPT
ncbi:carbohydrate-responsive element-binding protein isoform X1 [Plutella xylostella]|uniref:carbohydrate-responsive element-binding protein isoform X1 n=2 Tax=Plutella xylostella TaxID=51655 RepID=UPI0020326165|nr:carbohydrate-responsive element-binding protein isoform X1 [Plutella xylostella]